MLLLAVLQLRVLLVFSYDMNRACRLGVLTLLLIV